jgi:hypothetical protein
MRSPYNICCDILQETAYRDKRRPIEDILPQYFWELYKTLAEPQASELDRLMLYVNQINETRVIKRAA